MKPFREDQPPDPALLACVADLEASCATFTLPAERDASLARSLAARAEEQRRPHLSSGAAGRTRLAGPWQMARWRLSSVALALLLVLAGIGAYLHGQSPTPVSAQTVLHRAAAVSPGPHEATHSTYRLGASGGYTGTANVWVGTDAQGAPSDFALTITMVRNGQPAPDLSSQRVLSGQTMSVYDPATNTVTVSPAKGSDQQLEGMFVGVLVAQKLGRALAVGTQNSFTLQRQTLDGVPVYALSWAGAGRRTFYFNTQSYILEGADWVQAGKAWQARLDPASYQTMALGAVPPHTFALNAPSNARVVTLAPSLAPAKGAGGDPVINAAAAACHTTAGTFAAAVQAGNKSILAICQETAPGMTAQQLVAALVASFKPSLDAQVASGALTPAQQTNELAGLQNKLLRMVTGQPGTKAGAKQP